MKKSIYFGNSINRLSPSNISWEQLLDEIKGKRHFENLDLPYTMIYERIILERQVQMNDVLYEEGKVKYGIADKLINTAAHPVYKELFNLNVSNYITTNYDYAFRNTVKKDIKFTIKEKSSEDLYSIRRSIEIYNKNKKLIKSIWHIHGEISKPKSIMLGLDHYCGSIGKIDNYIKGTYEYQEKGKGIKLASIKEKLQNGSFDGVSWIELFFTTDIHIVGFSLDYSELDTWWILTKRARLIKDPEVGELIKNKIYYYTNKIYDPKKGMLESVGVQVKIIEVEESQESDYWFRYYDLLLNKLKEEITSIKSNKLGNSDEFWRWELNPYASEDPAHNK